MVVPKLKLLWSPELAEGAIPPDPLDCSVLLHAEIGPADTEGADSFAFAAVTPASLQRESAPVWGRGYLFLPEFSWPAVEQALEKLLMHAARPTWDQVATELNKELRWEFDNYRDEV